MIVGLRDMDALSVVPVKKTYQIAGKQFTFESGKVALLASGSVVISDDEGNVLLNTVGINERPNLSADFFPLTVEFQEKYYATGKIGGNRFMKREGRLSENAILNSRIIDRPIRPMFPKGVLNEVQIISTILSSSGEFDFGIHGVTGASLSLLLSGCSEFEGPVSGARIARMKDGSYVFDPKFEQLLECDLELAVAGTMDAITMVESQCKEVSEEMMIESFQVAFEYVQQICKAQLDFVENYKKSFELPQISLTKKEKKETIYAFVKENLSHARMDGLYKIGKKDFEHGLDVITEEMIVLFGGAEVLEVGDEKTMSEAVYENVKKYMRSQVLKEKLRLDGRALNQVRPIRGEFGILPRTHGSALFQRGLTQVLNVVTLGGPGDIQIVDDMFEETTKRYIHHYNFPPFSTGDIKMLRGPSRRDIGHGRLAEKALEPVLPSLDVFPYFIRSVSETQTCNGSSSMGSVCGSSMALMDAGVPISRPVSGVAMGLIYNEETGDYGILSDIQAQEDFLGDMDFKVARSEQGITALQMDCKIKGLKLSLLQEIFAQAKEATDSIRKDMTKDLAIPRTELSPYAPVILSFSVPVEKIREIIGKGGETIQKITRDFAVEIDITEKGIVSVTAKNGDMGQKAVSHIQSIIRGLQPEDILDGKVIRIIDGTGAIVEFSNGKSGMIHISKIAATRVENITDYLNAGDEVKVKVLTVDTENNRVGLSLIEKKAA